MQSDYTGDKNNLFDAVKEHLTAKLYRGRRNEPDLEGNDSIFAGENSVMKDGNRVIENIQGVTGRKATLDDISDTEDTYTVLNNMQEDNVKKHNHNINNDYMNKNDAKKDNIKTENTEEEKINNDNININNININNIKKENINVNNIKEESISIISDKKRIGLLSKFKNKVIEKKTVQLIESVKVAKFTEIVNLPAEDNTEFNDLKNAEINSINTEKGFSTDLYLIHRFDLFY